MKRRDAVLTALKDAGERGVSGELLAGALGVSRAAVAKHMAALRMMGYGIKGSAGAGYVLVSVPDLALPGEVGPLLESSFFAELRGGGETGSTNDDAKALARAGAPEGTVVLATRQTAGRGRFARAWSSPPGGVYVSVVLRPSLSLAEAAPLPLVISLGAACGLEALGVPARLKWPNDVVLPAGPSAAPGKLAGVLLEVSAEPDSVDWVVAGIGANVRRPSWSPFLDAAYAEDVLGSARTPSLARVAAAMLEGIAQVYTTFLSVGFQPLVAEYEAHWVLGGTTVRVSDAHGALLAAGKATGVDSYGRLIVMTEYGEVVLSAGEVTLRMPGGTRET